MPHLSPILYTGNIGSNREANRASSSKKNQGIELMPMKDSRRMDLKGNFEHLGCCHPESRWALTTIMPVFGTNLVEIRRVKTNRHFYIRSDAHAEWASNLCCVDRNSTYLYVLEPTLCPLLLSLKYDQFSRHIWQELDRTIKFLRTTVMYQRT